MALASASQGTIFKDYSLSLFPRFPAEIRNYVWKIAVEEYPARIINLREYRLSIPPTSPNSITVSRKGTSQPYKVTHNTREIAGFKSRVPAPTVLYICHYSRATAMKAYTKAFGTAEMPAETWIDFKKDMLYLTIDFCYLALERVPGTLEWPQYQTGRKEPYGYFRKELSQDIQKVLDLAISGLWHKGFKAPAIWRTGKAADVVILERLFCNLESSEIYLSSQARYFANQSAPPNSKLRFSTRLRSTRQRTFDSTTQVNDTLPRHTDGPIDIKTVKMGFFDIISAALPWSESEAEAVSGGSGTQSTPAQKGEEGEGEAIVSYVSYAEMDLREVDGLD
ncbi:hypothetical protein LSUE1_G008528 [Lachnellula suecica]|uniref:2EXR domain-containing protein n=1 Tax=Lachnellula suecica TaxID=602035 RepID=A0A8T9BZH2_9HELO|nr:hypothetical protein LSUE1_G008528 [Lachnellula suecica]